MRYVIGVLGVLAFLALSVWVLRKLGIRIHIAQPPNSHLKRKD